MTEGEFKNQIETAVELLEAANRTEDERIGWMCNAISHLEDAVFRQRKLRKPPSAAAAYAAVDHDYHLGGQE